MTTTRSRARSATANTLRGLVLGAVLARVARASADAPCPGAVPPPSATAAAALALCLRADAAPASERRALLERGLELAEEALTANDREPAAHFAAFCSLGKRVQLDGVGFGSLRAVRRMRHEVDRTLELAPDYVDALIGKGALLAEAPGFLGGDVSESERLPRRAVALAPANVDAHLRLGHVLLARGARAQALAEARSALAMATDVPEAEQAAEARSLIATAGER